MRKSIKIALNLSFCLFTLFTFSEQTLSLSDYQIKKICKKEKMNLTCIKSMQKKRYNLQKGNFIEIPVIPYKSNQEKNLNFKF